MSAAVIGVLLLLVVIESGLLLIAVFAIRNERDWRKGTQTDRDFYRDLYVKTDAHCRDLLRLSQEAIDLNAREGSGR